MRASTFKRIVGVPIAQLNGMRRNLKFGYVFTSFFYLCVLVGVFFKE